MSSHPSTSRARSWRLLAAVLAVVLVLVVAAGLWARWRPLSDDDAARLAGRATVESVRARLHAGSAPPSEAALLPDAVLDRQLDALGPPATPSQTRHMAQRDGESPAVDSLSEAADRLARKAEDVDDGELAASLAAVAASWWAADGSAGGEDAPSDRSEATSTPTTGSAASTATAGEAPAPGADTPSGSTAAEDSDAPARCEAEQITAVTALDRAHFVAEAAQARLATRDAARSAVDASATQLRDALEDGRAAQLLGCDPGPISAHYDLPGALTADPARATGAAEHEAVAAVVGAVGTTSPGERPWWLETLQDTARSAQQLDPQEPVTALPGRD